MFCNKCGTQNPDGSKFCSSCGNSVFSAYTPSAGQDQITMVPPHQSVSTNPPPPKKNNKLTILIAAVVAIILVAGIILGAIWFKNNNNSEKEHNDEGTSSSSTLSETEDDTTKKSDSEEKTDEPADDDTISSQPSGGSSSKISRGQTNGSIYSNGFFGITFTKPSNWIYADDEALAKMINSTADALGYSDFEQTLMQNSTVYDMMAVDPTGSPNVMVTFTDLASTGNRYITVDNYVDELAQGLTAQEALSYSVRNKFETTMGGNNYSVLEVQASANNTLVLQRYYVQKVDKYMCTIIVSASSESAFEAVENMFSASV